MRTYDAIRAHLQRIKVRTVRTYDAIRAHLQWIKVRTVRTVTVYVHCVAFGSPLEAATQATGREIRMPEVYDGKPRAARGK